MNLEQNTKCVSRIFLIFLIFHGIYSFTPFLREMQIVMYMDFLFVILWFLYFLFTNTNYRKELNAITIIFIISLLYKVVGYSTGKVGACLSYFSFFAPLIFGWHLINNASRKQLLCIVISYSLIIVFNVAYNCVILYPFKDLNLTDEQILELHKSLFNIGNTNFNGFVLLATLCYWFVSCFSQNKIYKCCSFIITLLSSYFIIFLCQRGTTSVLLIVGFLMISSIVLLRKQVKNINRINIYILLIVFLIYENLNYIIPVLAEFSPSERLTVRLNDILATQQSGISEDSFTGRGSLFIISFDSLFGSIGSFFFGIGEPLMEGDYKKIGISGHSDVFDTLAKYGIVGFFIIIRILKLYYKNIKQTYKNSSILPVFQAILIIFLVYGVMHTIFWQNSSAVLFIMLPAMFTLISSNMQSNGKYI